MYEFGKLPQLPDSTDFDFSLVAVKEYRKDLMDLLEEHPEYIHPEALELVKKLLIALSDVAQQTFQYMKELTEYGS